MGHDSYFYHYYYLDSESSPSSRAAFDRVARPLSHVTWREAPVEIKRPPFSWRKSRDQMKRRERVRLCLATRCQVKGTAPSSQRPLGFGEFPTLYQESFTGVGKPPATPLTPGLRACLEREEPRVLPDWSCQRLPLMNGGKGETCLF